MIAHMVAFRWRDGTSAADIAAIDAAIGSLPARIPGIVAYGHGPDLRMRDGNDDYGVIAVLDYPDVADYLDHEAHLQVAADVVSQHVADRHSIQFTVHDDHPLAAARRLPSTRTADNPSERTTA